MNVDDGLEDIRWIRGRGGEKLPAASYALLPNLRKGLFFVAIGEGSRKNVACFLPGTQQRPNVFVSDAWPAPATYHALQVTIKTNLLAELKHQAPN